MKWVGLAGLIGALWVAWECFNAPFSHSEMDTEFLSTQADER